MVRGHPQAELARCGSPWAREESRAALRWEDGREAFGGNSGHVCGGRGVAGEGTSPRTGCCLVVNCDCVCKQRLWLSVGTARWLALWDCHGTTALPVHGWRRVAAGDGCS